MLEELPKLQSLVVSRLPFFDHVALLALRNPSVGRKASLGDSLTFSLRLLIATYCQNTTSSGLGEALNHFPNLAFLDLSNTLAARDWIVLRKLRNLPLLQVLKLRKIHLKDEDIEILAHSIGVRVRSLDVQGNHLTDHSVRTLLSNCFQVDDRSNGSSGHMPGPSSDLTLEDWPAGFVRPDPAVLDEFKDESYDDRFIRRLTTGIVSRLPYEDLPYSGITHLHIADNHLTVEGVAALVMSNKLYVLDAGTVNNGKPVNNPHSETFPSVDARYIGLPGAEKLTPVLAKCAQKLTSLRLHHAIVTERTPPRDENPALAMCELGIDTMKPELDGPMPSELDATPPLYEMDNEDAQPRYELPGSSIYVMISPSIGKKPALSEEESQPQPRRGSAFAPEVVEAEGTKDDVSPILTATGLGPMAQAVNGVSSLGDSFSRESNAEASGAGNGNTEMQRTLIERQRRELRSRRLDKPHGLFPGMLPKLRTLTLTDVPCFEKSRHTVDALIQFVRDCASETELADLQARLEPGPLRKSGHRQPSSSHKRREIFALQRLVLEMAPSEPSCVAKGITVSKYAKRTKSSTEDADSEAFWSAAENDFTFFDNDEECGLPSIEPNSYVPYASLNEKMTTPDSPIDKSPALRRSAANEPLIDVVQELAKFRKERQALYEEAMKRGVRHVEGYWPGEVKVIRGHHANGKADYYGNYFEQGGVYR